MKPLFSLLSLLIYHEMNGATATTAQSIPADIAQRSTITWQILEGDLASHNITITSVEILRCLISCVTLETITRINHPIVSLSIYTAKLKKRYGLIED